MECYGCTKYQSSDHLPPRRVKQLMNGPQSVNKNLRYLKKKTSNNKPTNDNICHDRHDLLIRASVLWLRTNKFAAFQVSYNHSYTNCLYTLPLLFRCYGGLSLRINFKYSHFRNDRIWYFICLKLSILRFIRDQLLHLLLQMYILYDERYVKLIILVHR